MPEKENFLDLLQGYLANTLDPAQEQAFFHQLSQDVYRHELGEALDAYLHHDNFSGPEIKEGRLRDIEASILSARRSRVHLWRWWSVAAALLLMAFSAYWIFQHMQDQTGAGQLRANLVLPPAESKATLLMELGKTVSLDRLGQVGDGPKLIDKEHISYNNLDQDYASDTIMNACIIPAD